MEPEVAAVERGLRDSLGPGRLGQLLTDLGRGLGVRPVLEPGVLAGARRRCQGDAVQVVDELGGDVQVRAEDREPGPLGRPVDALAHAVPPPLCPPRLEFLWVHFCQESGVRNQESENPPGLQAADRCGAD